MSALLREDASIRPMQPSDLEDVLDIERAVYEFPWTRGNFNDSLCAGYNCWMYRQDGLAVGYCVSMIAAGEAHLLNLSIALPMQRAGHGRRLLEHALADAREQAAQLLFLEVRPSNAAARALYERRGFRQIGVRRGYYPAHAGHEDALVLSIELT